MIGLSLALNLHRGLFAHKWVTWSRLRLDVGFNKCSLTSSREILSPTPPPHPHMSVKQIRFCLYVVLVSDLDHVAEQEKAPS